MRSPDYLPHQICPTCGNVVKPLLTPREIEVANLLVLGKSNPDIGQSLGISSRTVKAYVKSLMSKLQIHDRKRVSLALAWSCEIFRLGAGYEAPFTSAADVIERDKLRAEENRKRANITD